MCLWQTHIAKMTIRPEVGGKRRKLTKYMYLAGSSHDQLAIPTLPSGEGTSAIERETHWFE